MSCCGGCLKTFSSTNQVYLKRVHEASDLDRCRFPQSYGKARDNALQYRCIGRQVFHREPEKLFELVDVRKCVAEQVGIRKCGSKRWTTRSEPLVQLERDKSSRKCSQTMLPSNVRFSRQVNSEADCEERNCQKLKSGNQKTLSRKTVHFMPKSQLEFFPLASSSSQKEVSNQKANTRKLLVQSSKCFSNGTLPRNPQHLTLKHFHPKDKKTGSGGKLHRLLLREYRLRRWVELSGEDHDPSSKFNQLQLVPFLSRDDLSVKTDKPVRETKTMQERAFGNLSKVQAIITSSSAFQLSQRLECEQTMKFSGGHLVEKDEELFDISNLKSTLAPEGESACHEPNACGDGNNIIGECKYVNNLTTERSPKCRDVIEAQPRRSTRSPIISCTWWQNNTKINVFSATPSEDIFTSRANQIDVCNDVKRPELLNSQLSQTSAFQHKQGCDTVAEIAEKFEQNEGSINRIYRPRETTQTTRTSFESNPIHMRTSNHSRDHPERCDWEKTYQNNLNNGKLFMERTQNSNCLRSDSGGRRNSSERPGIYTSSTDQYLCRCCHTFPTQPTFWNTDKIPIIPASVKSANARDENRVQNAHYSNCSACNRNFQNCSVYLEKPLTGSNSPLFNSRSGVIFVKTGKNEAVILKCSCKICSQKYSPYMKSKKRPNIKKKASMKSRPKIGKHKVPRSYQGHKATSTKRMTSKKSNASTATRSSTTGLMGLCFRCFDGDSDSSSSGGSDTDNGDGDDCDDEDGYEEHGEEVSAGEDSGGGDSGSDSGEEESLNSAELYDGQNNMNDTTQTFGEGDGSDGPASLESDCSDSLTELRSKMKRERGSNDEDEDDDDDDQTEDDDHFINSWESLAIYEGE